VLCGESLQVPILTSLPLCTSALMKHRCSSAPSRNLRRYMREIKSSEATFTPALSQVSHRVRHKRCHDIMQFEGTAYWIRAVCLTLHPSCGCTTVRGTPAAMGELMTCPKGTSSPWIAYQESLAGLAAHLQSFQQTGLLPLSCHRPVLRLACLLRLCCGQLLTLFSALEPLKDALTSCCCH